MSKTQKKDRVIGTFQGIDVHLSYDGVTYMDLAGIEEFYLGVENDALEELQKLKEALKAKRSKADIDAEIGDILRASVEEGEDDDCLARGDGNADKLRNLCKEPWV